jgi:hypothetical protein
MTVYSDWLRDFPNRCIETLALLEPKARVHGREVTLLLSVGSILLNVPMERLKVRLDKLQQPIEHPMTGHPDEAARNANRALALKFRAMLDEKFATSPTLWGSSKRPEKGQWWAGNLGREYNPARPVDWFGMGPNGHGMPDNWAVERVISVIRNACAHAHVLTYGSLTGKELVVEDKQQISRLLFVSLRGPLDEQPTKFRFVGTTPDGFGELLERWAAVIPELDPLGDIRSGDDEPHLHLTENF